MAKENQENLAYLNFLEDLNDILTNFNIKKLSHL